MYTLRNSQFTYEVSRATDVHRPRMLMQLEHRRAADLARVLYQESDNRRAIIALVQGEIGRITPEDMLEERFVELVMCGRLVLLEREVPNIHPLLDPRPAQPVPLSSLSEEEPGPETTWISVELVDSLGLSTADLELECVTPEGKEIYGRLDGDGRWRATGIVRGSCSVRLLEHPVLAERRRRSLQVRPQRDDVVWRVGSDRRFDLRTCGHHRIVIMQPPRPYCLSA